jgi:hypothetical protein
MCNIVNPMKESGPSCRQTRSARAALPTTSRKPSGSSRPSLALPFRSWACTRPCRIELSCRRTQGLPALLLCLLQRQMIQVAVTPQQHGLIAMTKDLRGHANTDAISQQRCCHPVADVMYPQIGTPEHARQTRPLLSVANGCYATFASEDQSIRRAGGQRRL